MSKKSMWSLQFSTAALVLIPTAVGINYIGKFFAGLLKLPLWVDSIGTVLAGMLAGPIIGALSGFINNIIYGLTADPISFVYGITSVIIGMVAGVMARKGYIKSLSSACVIGLVMGLVAAVVSTPLNVIFWGGTTGNFWGDALFAVVLNSTKSLWIASFLDEIVVDLPDKVVTVLLAFAIYKGLPKTLTQLFQSDDEIEKIS